MNRLLLLEDDISLVDGLVYTLEKNGFCLDVARTIQEFCPFSALPEEFGKCP